MGVLGTRRVNRLTSALLSREAAGKARARITNDWVMSAAMYLLWVFATIPPWVPALGITPGSTASADLLGRGAWVEQPIVSSPPAPATS